VIQERADIQAGFAGRAALNASWWQGWFGTGFGAFPEYQRPHNAFLSLWAQAGILTIPILAAPVWYARKVGLRHLAALAPALILADWLFSTPGGIAALAVYGRLAQEKQLRPSDDPKCSE
jgi:hypothetical protein